MREVNQLMQIEARGMVVGQRRQVGEFGLAYDELCSRLVKEHVMHDAAPPDDNTMLATESFVSD